ncbi:5,10-methylenetetrahydromethanopterin reductase [Haloarchaeobius sp. HME9146]|uniref:5,10-methylenetetrahydromethanopterin reductase n=1 Tax=Haloarchaeobius sp. HME9146 TaxID=2978732 RepID=UPI0021C1DB75|nr:5,10-methylenetetrahydromethanopterin reductase [Haloarchaeobius sp. HME9146]MCT9095456.1 5,10-methylenetetrahydromethanopterin reductase [Haloarchaeobius sp. HME9146]
MRRLGIELTPEHPMDELLATAQAAEDAGFDTLFASSHHFNRDPFVVCDRIARETDLDVGPGVVNPYETHPVSLASRMATLDETTDGSAVFGIGAGDKSALSNLGYEHDRPLRRVLESFKVAQRLWDGERVNHDGTFQATAAELNFDVGHIPVYVGAQGPHMIRMAAKHADGVLLNGSHPRDFEWAAERVEEGLAERPDSRGEFDFAAFASVSIAEDAQAAREAARPPVAFIAAGAAPPVLDRHGLDHDAVAAVGEALGEGEFTEAFGRVTEPMLDAFCIAGTPDQVGEKIADVLEYADSFVAGTPLGPEPTTAPRLLAAAIERSSGR